MLHYYKNVLSSCLLALLGGARLAFLVSATMPMTGCYQLHVLWLRIDDTDRKRMCIITVTKIIALSNRTQHMVLCGHGTCDSFDTLGLST